MIVVSDLEGTLTGGATWIGMRDYFKQNGRRAAYRIRFALGLPRFVLVKLGLADEQDTKNAWLLSMLDMMAGADEAEFLKMSEWVVEHEMWPKRRADVLEEFEQRRQNGARIVVASGTFQAITEAFARRIGAEALGSDVETAGGRITGRLIGQVSVREIKARRAQSYLDGEAIDFAYGDSPSDVPLLELAREAVAVYPDARLRGIAAKRGWRIIGPEG